MLDVAKMLGPEWKIDSSEVVTSDNQMSMSNDLPDVCELKQKATKVDSAWGGQPSYAPPLGWTVYYVSRPAGYDAEALSLRDTIWVDPTGVAYSVTSCAKGVSTGSDIVDQSSKSSSAWLLLGALGLLALFTFSE